MVYWRRAEFWQKKYVQQWERMIMSWETGIRAKNSLDWMNLSALACQYDRETTIHDFGKLNRRNLQAGTFFQ